MAGTLVAVKRLSRPISGVGWDGFALGVFWPKIAGDKAMNASPAATTASEDNLLTGIPLLLFEFRC
jgi:hypothetical protein